MLKNELVCLQACGLLYHSKDGDCVGAPQLADAEQCVSFFERVLYFRSWEMEAFEHKYVQLVLKRMCSMDNDRCGFGSKTRDCTTNSETIDRMDLRNPEKKLRRS